MHAPNIACNPRIGPSSFSVHQDDDADESIPEGENSSDGEGMMAEENAIDDGEVESSTEVASEGGPGHQCGGRERPYNK